jgi:hypothetical protein
MKTTLKNTEKYVVLCGLTRADSGYPAGCPVELEVEIRAGKNTVAPYLNIDLEPLPEYVEISVCGSVWQKARRDIYSGGQNIEEIAAMFPENVRVQEIAAIWRRWHLNGLNSGTRAQREFIDQHKAANPEWRYDYSEACELLKAAGLYEDRGYKYGSPWLAEAPPVEVVERLRKLVKTTA